MARALARDERGAIVVLGVFMGCFLVGATWYVMGVGDAAIYAQQLSQAADAASFAGAVYHARGMNVIAMLNVIMAATITVLAGTKVAAELMRYVQHYADTACTMEAIEDENGVVVIDDPGEPWCDDADDAEKYAIMLGQIIGAIDDHADGMMAGLSRGQVQVAQDVPWMAREKTAHTSTEYRAIGAPIVDVSVVSRSLEPSETRLGLPVEQEPFELMCMRGHDLMAEVVLVVVDVVVGDAPLLRTFLRSDRLAHFIGSYPLAYCHGNALNFDIDFIRTSDTCNEILAEHGSNAASGSSVRRAMGTSTFRFGRSSRATLIS